MTTATDILNALESSLMALDPPHVRLVQGASDFVAVKNWLHDKRAEIAKEVANQSSVDRIIAAMANIHWVQFTMNGGGCFHVDPDGTLCGRAIRWAGHQSEDADHLFVPLHVAATKLAKSAPAPVRISPEVRETILRALRMVLSQDESRARWVECRQDYVELVGRIDTGKAAIAFVEAL